MLLFPLCTPPSAQGLRVMRLQTVYTCLVTTWARHTARVSARKAYTLLGRMGETEAWSDEMPKEVPKVNAGDS